MKIKLSVILFLLTSSSFASFDLAILYRANGIKPVEIELNKQFENKLFWTKYLENIDTTNGYFESIKYTLICKPDLKSIDVYKNEHNGKTKIFESNILSGKISGAKSLDGDLKTPIGTYELINKIVPPDQFYGPLALITNYPNSFDKINNKTGDGIWIHGLPFSGNRDPYTKGCIAMENENLKKLDKSIDFSQSILIIGNMDENISNKNSIANVLSNFYSWKNAWQTGDFETYLSFYSKNFKKLDGSDFNKFSSYKKSIFERNDEKTILVKDINIIPYPNTENKNMYKIQYHQTYSTKTYHSVGKKELYIELIDDKIQILYEG